MHIQHATAVRREFQEVIDSVHYTKEPVIVCKRNKPWVMIVPLPEDDPDLKGLVQKGRI